VCAGRFRPVRSRGRWARGADRAAADRRRPDSGEPGPGGGSGGGGWMVRLRRSDPGPPIAGDPSSGGRRHFLADPARGSRHGLSTGPGRRDHPASRQDHIRHGVGCPTCRARPRPCRDRRTRVLDRRMPRRTGIAARPSGGRLMRHPRRY
jgi:hypothetical protein